MDLYLHQTLPFSDIHFYVFAFIAVVLTFLIKLLFSQSYPSLYRYWILTIGIFYCSVLFTNPLGIFGFTLFGFALYRFLSFQKGESNFLTVILYVLPLLLNKLLHILPNFKTDLRGILQIAGLSYMTFKMLQIHFDERNNQQISYLEYLNFLIFPPTLLIGPIDRFHRFNQDITSGFKELNQEQIIAGLNFFSMGILYKYIVAMAIQMLILDHLEGFSGLTYHLAEMYSYLIYLFFDFAGYSLLAMGFGYLLGIRVPHNFDQPFLAINPKEFWQRWHKTLGDWLNDYFFKPILRYLTTKNVFTPITRQSIALFSTFTLMGFWNGFELHYIMSGMLFGLYSVIHNYYQMQCKKQKRDVVFGNMNPLLVKYISIFIMFHSVAISIYIFSGKLF